MKERPIIFKDEMVRAILDGRKTQTRRVVKQPKRWQGKYDQLCPETLLGHEAWWWDGVHGRVGASQPCPYGQPGDRLWVRETFADEGCRQDRDDCYYRADGECDLQGGRWTPSIHMPRWASRILLEVISVRVERLQDISEADALAEGGPEDSPCGDAVGWFADLWDKINGDDAWATNPWVWVVEFHRIEQESAAE